MPLDDVRTGIGAEPLAADDPRQIGPFPIKAVLGSGGMGRVYLGVAPGQYVAVKQVRPELAQDKVFAGRFGQELDNQARLPVGVSPRLLANDRTAQPPWFATEYVPGVTLEQAVDLLGGPLPVADCWVLLRELATLLHALANDNLVHRDLKPSNIMLTAEGVTLIDFGLSRTTLQTSVTTGRSPGTPPYMAPEQLSEHRKPPAPAVDIFALGGVITYAATGEPPFGNDAAVGYRIAHEKPHLDALRAADPELARVVASCLDKNPKRRPRAAALPGMREPARTPSWPAPVTEHIRLRSITPDQPDLTGSTGIATAATSFATSATGPLSTPRGGAPESPGSAPEPERLETGPATGPVRGRGRHKKQPPAKRDRRKLMFIVIPLVIVVGGGITVMSLLPPTHSKAAPDPKPARSLTGPVPSHPSASPTKAKPSPSNSPVALSTTPAAPAPAPVSAPSASVVSFTSHDKLENKADHLCLADSGNWTSESLPCGSNADLGWKAVKEPGNKFELVDGSYGDCATDYGSMVQVAPCTGAQSVTTFWRIGTTTSGGSTLVDDATGACMSSADTTGSSGFDTTTCNPSDPHQLWLDAGKA